jgi:hypothetical protein
MKINMNGKFRPTVTIGIIALVIIVAIAARSMPADAGDVTKLVAGGLVAIVTLLVTHKDPGKED